MKIDEAYELLSVTLRSALGVDPAATLDLRAELRKAIAVADGGTGRLPTPEQQGQLFQILDKIKSKCPKYCDCPLYRMALRFARSLESLAYADDPECDDNHPRHQRGPWLIPVATFESTEEEIPF